MKNDENVIKDAVIEQMFQAGVHYGYSRSKRHSSAKPFLFGNKGGSDIFDLGKTKQSLEDAKDFIKKIIASDKQVLFVSSKNEAKTIIKDAAESIDMPYVSGRWIGGTLTNFSEIKKRVAKLEKLRQEKESGEWSSKYNKKEQLKLTKEIEKLEKHFAGLVSMKVLPAVLFVIDSKKEKIAVIEAGKMNIPVVALANSDCDFLSVSYPLAGNDTSKTSIEFFVKQIVGTYKKVSE
jgi:small subunit ribosomal protein S2